MVSWNRRETVDHKESKCLRTVANMILLDRSMNLDLNVDGLSEAETMHSMAIARAPLTTSWNCVRPWGASVTARILIQIRTRFGASSLLFVGHLISHSIVRYAQRGFLI